MSVSGGGDRLNPRPRILDLFCGAGGAAMGYHRAGFAVLGVDVAPQPHYPFAFVQADAMTYPLEGFNAIHASPPCQRFTSMSNRHRGAGGLADERVDLLTATLERLSRLSVPWVVENVPGARRAMRGYDAFTLTGGMFGLGVHRPRLFATNTLILPPPPAPVPAHSVGVYGKAPDGRRLWKTYRAARSLEEAQVAMGMDWADWHGTKEAIPPAYTTYIGAQLIACLEPAA